MFPASTQGSGMCFVFPDVCKSPAPPAPSIPVPYPETGPPLGNKRASKVKIQDKKAAAKRSTFSRSSGNQAGTIGGVVSSKSLGWSTQRNALVYKLQTQGFSSDGAKRMVEGKPVQSAADVKLLQGILSSP